MIQWLFLDGIDAEAAGAAVGCQDDFVICTSAHETESALAVPELTKAGTKVALQPAVINLVPVASRYTHDIGVFRTLFLLLNHCTIIGRWDGLSIASHPMDTLARQAKINHYRRG
jgi:hypothetical protein